MSCEQQVILFFWSAHHIYSIGCLPSNCLLRFCFLSSSFLKVTGSQRSKVKLYIYVCICLGLSFSFLWHLPLLDPTSWILLFKKKKILQSLYQVCSSNAIGLFGIPSLTCLFFLQFKWLIIWNFILHVEFEWVRCWDEKVHPLGD